MLQGAFFMLFLVLTSCATVPVRNEEKEADFHYKMGSASLSEGNLQAAFVEFQKTLQLNPNYKDALINLGYIHLQFEEFEKAKGLFLRAISVDSEFSDAYTYLGITYIKMRQWKEAIGPLKKALSNVIYKTPGKAFYYLGMAYYRSGLFDDAIDAFKDSIRRSPSAPEAYYGLSLTYNKTGRYGDAAAIIERAIGIDPAFNSDKAKFISEMKQSLLTAKGEDETDTRDYLEIMKY
jgi:tetratricopeptide (TPR) repeat protein